MYVNTYTSSVKQSQKPAFDQKGDGEGGGLNQKSFLDTLHMVSY